MGPISKQTMVLTPSLKYFHIILIRTQLLNSCQLVLFKPWYVVFIKNYIEYDYPHHVIRIAPSDECTDGIAKPAQ